MATITFKDGTVFDYTAVNAIPKEIIQGVFRNKLEVVFPAETVDIEAVRVVAKNAFALSEFTLQTDEGTFTHYGYNIVHSISENLQNGTISLILAEISAVEKQAESYEEVLIYILANILPNV